MTTPNTQQPGPFQPGAEPPKKKRGLGKKIGIGCGAAFAVIIAMGIIADATMSDEDRAAAEQRSVEREAEKSRESEAKRSKEARESMEKEAEKSREEETTRAEEEPREEPKEEETTTEAAPATAGVSDEEQWLLDQWGVDDFSEILAQDPSLWGGYVTGVEEKRGTLHVRLQIDRDRDQEMADRAAKALGNFIRLGDDDRVKGVHFVVVEDGAGTSMASEMV